MEEFLPSELRRLRLSRSEPLVNQKRQFPKHQYNEEATSCHPFTTKFLQNKEHVFQPKPPIQRKPPLTVVSPQRKVRIPVESLNDLRRYKGDGASSSCSTVNNSEDSIHLVRMPGDGCYSDDDSEVAEDHFVNNENESSNESILEEDLSDISVNDWEHTRSSSLFSEALNTSHSGTSRESSYHRISAHSSTSDAPLPLLKSLFPKKPPTLYFTLEHERISQFPVELRNLLKWRSSTVTPKVVKDCLTRTGFRLTKRSIDWLGTWGKHMKATAFQSLKEYQKINHFPGTFHIGRKDKLWRNYSKMKAMHGQKEFNFLPATFILPQDMTLLKKAWDDSGPKAKWIVKPPASARGIGIKVIHKWSQVLKRKPVIVQKYLSRPYLINGSKFDLRIYVYVSSFDPLKIYIFNDGLVRFATSKYSTSTKTLSNKYIHLTNYSINKRNVDVYNTAEKDSTHQKSYKWSLKSLWTYFQRKGIDYRSLWRQVKDIAVKSIICGEAAINSQIKQNLKSRYCCHELFGLDILLDSHLKAWLLEVNISPSLHSKSELDKMIKQQLVKDILNVAGISLPMKFLETLPSLSANLDELGADMYWFLQHALTRDEKNKHTYYIQRGQNQKLLDSILEKLTTDDLRILMEAEDELSRCGDLERIFPSTEKNYLQFFEVNRYYDLLLHAWTQKYTKDSYRPLIGISLLRSYAEEERHLPKDKRQAALSTEKKRPSISYSQEQRRVNGGLVTSIHRTKKASIKPAFNNSNKSNYAPKNLIKVSMHRLTDSER